MLEEIEIKDKIRALHKLLYKDLPKHRYIELIEEVYGVNLNIILKTNLSFNNIIYYVSVVPSVDYEKHLNQDKVYRVDEIVMLAKNSKIYVLQSHLMKRGSKEVTEEESNWIKQNKAEFNKIEYIKYPFNETIKKEYELAKAKYPKEKLEEELDFYKRQLNELQKLLLK